MSRLVEKKGDGRPAASAASFLDDHLQGERHIGHEILACCAGDELLSLDVDGIRWADNSLILKNQEKDQPLCLFQR